MRKLVVLTLTIALIALMGGSASANPSRTVNIVGQEHLIPNAVLNATFHYAPGTISIDQNGTLTFVNHTDAPHTVSLVNERDLPTSVPLVFRCAAGLCRTILNAHHAFTPAQVSVIEAGAPGLDTPTNSTPPVTVGDSLFVAPGQTVSAKVSAPSGTQLYYLCAIHPWMQGEIDVR